MQKLFNKILVPVDFSTPSKNAVAKAVQLAGEYQCSITLLHATGIQAGPGHFLKNDVSKKNISNSKETEFRLKKIAANGYKNAGVQLNNINTEVQVGSWNDCMINYINKHQIDLVLVGQKNILSVLSSSKFNADFIASKTNVPVITIPYRKKITRLNTILIPVTDFLPVRKIMYGIYMATASNATLQLLQVKNRKPGDSSEYYLYKSYRLIQENCSIHTDMQTVKGDNVAAAITEYMQEKNADLVIVNPGVQTKMPGLFSRLLGRLLQQQTESPVMTLSPL